MKQVNIFDFLTGEEVNRATVLRKAALISREIIEPNIKRINLDLGQENDPMYLAYAVEYVVTQINNLQDTGI